MNLPKPTVTARFAAGWAYLTVPRHEGANTQLEALLNGVWTTPYNPHPHGADEFYVAMYRDGSPTEFRVRYTSNSEQGPYLTGRVSFPSTLVVDDGSTPTPPSPDVTPAKPTGLAVAKTGESYTATWNPVAGASFYRVQLKTPGAAPQKVTQPRTELLALSAGSHTVGVVAVAQNAEGFEFVSEEATATFTVEAAPKPPDPDPDPDPPKPQRPATPRHVRAHCISHQSTKVEWDRDPTVTEYEVWIDPHRGEAQRTGDTLVTVKGLQPATNYVAKVVAHNAAGESEPGQIAFKTGVAEPDPDPDPDVEVGADFPAPDLMVWPLEGGKVRATWSDPDDGSKPKSWMGYPFWHVSLDQRTWYFTKQREYEFEVADGAEVMVSVYGVWDNKLTAIATKGVAL